LGLPEDGPAGYFGLAYDKRAEDAGVLKRCDWLPPSVEAAWSGAGFNRDGALRIDYLENHSRDAVTVTIPAGAVFSPRCDRSQQNLIVRDERSIDLAPGATMRGIELFAYCGNRTLHSPAEETFEVTEFVVTVDLSNQGTVWKLLCPFYTPTVTKQFTKQYGFLTPKPPRRAWEEPGFEELLETLDCQDVLCFPKGSIDLPAGAAGAVARLVAAAQGGCVVQLLAGSSMGAEERLRVVRDALLAQGVGNREITTEVTPRCTGWFAAGAVVVRLTVRLPADPAAEKKEFSAWLRDSFRPVED